MPRLRSCCWARHVALNNPHPRLTFYSPYRLPARPSPAAPAGHLPHLPQVQRQEERKQSLAEKAKTTSEELQRKAKAEAEAAAEATAKRAKVQEERAAAAREYLRPRVAAAADKGQVRQGGKTNVEGARVAKKG